MKNQLFENLAAFDDAIEEYKKRRAEFPNAALVSFDDVKTKFYNIKDAASSVQSKLSKLFAVKKETYAASWNYIAATNSIELHTGDDFTATVEKFADALINYKRATTPVESVEYCDNERDSITDPQYLLDEECQEWTDDTPFYVFGNLSCGVKEETKEGRLVFHCNGIHRVRRGIMTTYTVDWREVTARALTESFFMSDSCFEEVIDDGCGLIDDDGKLTLPDDCEEIAAFKRRIQEQVEYLVEWDLYDCAQRYSFISDDEENDED